MNREISPLDGRYRERLVPLGDYFSEFALVKARCEVELRYLAALDKAGLFPPFSEEEHERIRSAIDSFEDADFLRVKEIEREIRHDVKACELFLRERLDLDRPNLIHFGLTSADVNNLAYGLILTRFRDEIQLPLLRKLVTLLLDLAELWKGIPFPARTHGQPASPTTAGKEIAVFVERLVRQAKQLEAASFPGKANGATGTYASFRAAFPDFDWPTFSDAFVSSLDLEPSLCTTQIEGGDGLAEYFAITSRINCIVRDLDRDLWEYISRGELVQRAVKEEVGSSTMPHKVNPIRFENSEGNVAISNALLHTLSEELTHSRMQRDLSDTTIRRNIGVALAHAHLAVGEAFRGLGEVDIDERAAREHVEETPQVLAEAVQMVLRAEGHPAPYDALKALARGSELTLDRLHDFIRDLSIPEESRERLCSLRPVDYVGLAAELCERAVEHARAWLAGGSPNASRS